MSFFSLSPVSCNVWCGAYRFLTALAQCSALYDTFSAALLP